MLLKSSEPERRLSVTPRARTGSGKRWKIGGVVLLVDFARTSPLLNLAIAQGGVWTDLLKCQALEMRSGDVVGPVPSTGEGEPLLLCCAGAGR